MQLMVEENAEDPKMLIMKSKDNGCLGRARGSVHMRRSFRIGRFGTPSLRELREVRCETARGPCR